MAKVAVLVPNQEMSTIAKSLTGEFPSISLMAIESIQTDQAVRRAGELEQQGCDLIVARGVQARAIKRSVKLPLVEISVSQQELASVVLELKEELGLPCPRIGLIGLSNMFSDTSQFDRLFGIDLDLYMVEQNDELAAAAVRAFSDGCNAVIGGDIVCENARREKLPYKFIPSGVESLRNALTVAARVAYAIDLEKRNSAEINALLNYTFSGIVQVDREGIIRRVNRISYNLLEHPADTLLGRPISEILPNLNQNVLDNALIGGQEAYAFVTIDCSAWLPETLDNMLFGNYTVRKDSTVDSYAEMAQDGTLYLSHVEMLPPETQYKLLCLIRGRFLHNGPSRPVAANVRVIASSAVNLISRVEKGEFRSDLYYALSVLSLEVLPLRRRRADILGWTELYLDDWQEKYKRYVHLTQGARDYLLDYEWPGNLDQLCSVCERLVLLTRKRNIDEVFLRQQLEQVTPRMLPGTEQIVLYKDQKAVEIAALLKKYHGNRQKIADELGVSKTTLWRYLKKFDIKPEYNC